MGKRAGLSAAIDALSDVMPNGALTVATDPVAFLLSARDELSTLRARVAELEAGIVAERERHRVTGESLAMARMDGDAAADALEKRVAELERTEGIAAGMLDEATAMLDAERARADAAERRAAESAGALDLLDLYESRRRGAESRAIAAEERVCEMWIALDALLYAAERQASGFPLPSEEWFAARDTARAAIAAGAEGAEREGTR